MHYQFKMIAALKKISHSDFLAMPCVISYAKMQLSFSVGFILNRGNRVLRQVQWTHSFVKSSG